MNPDDRLRNENTRDLLLTMAEAAALADLVDAVQATRLEDVAKFCTGLAMTARSENERDTFKGLSSDLYAVAEALRKVTEA